MIVINNVRFSEKGEGMDGAFGYAKRLKSQIKLFNLKHVQIGVLTGYGVLAAATPLDNGKTWYSYANIEGVGEVSFSDKQALLDELSVSWRWLKRGERKYCFR